MPIVQTTRQIEEAGTQPQRGAIADSSANVDNEELLSPRQLSERYPWLFTSMVYRLCREGLLVHFRVGGMGKRGKLLIPVPRAIETYLRTCQVELHPLIG